MLKKIEIANKNLWGRLFGFFIRNEISGLPLDGRKIKRILVLRTDFIGDMVVTIPLIRRIKKILPNVEISVFASEMNKTIIEDDPDVNKLYVKRGNIIAHLREIIRCKKDSHDLILNANISKSLTFSILSNYYSPSGIKVGSDVNGVYGYCYNRLIDIGRDNTQHMADMLLKYADIFDVKSSKEEVHIDLHISDKSKADAGAILTEAGLNETGFIFLNISARRENKKPSDSLLRRLVGNLPELTGSHVLISSDPSEREKLSILSDEFSEKRLHVAPEVELKTLIAIMARSKLVITPDTAVVHLACGAGVPVAAFFSRAEKFYSEWQPIGVPYLSIFSKGSEPVSEIDPDIALDQIIEFHAELNKE